MGICAPAFSAGPQQDPHALVAQMVHNELKAGNQKWFWMYVDTKQEGGRTEVARVIETPQCWLTWPISVKGDGASDKESQEREKFKQLVNDPAACQRQHAQVNEDDKKADSLTKILPDAFLYTVENEQDGKIRLKFRPNPHFKPATREAKVFHNMQGILVIDEKETRLASIEGKLMSDVSFGLGVLARLQKGGTFKAVQSEIRPQDWELTSLDVHIAGRALFFKTINEQQHEVKSDFQPVPKDITVAQAAEMVKKNANISASAEHGQ
jgi:hypothetical protein